MWVCVTACKILKMHDYEKHQFLHWDEVDKSDKKKKSSLKNTQEHSFVIVCKLPEGVSMMWGNPVALVYGAWIMHCFAGNTTHGNQRRTWTVQSLSASSWRPIKKEAAEAHPAASPPAQALLWPVPKTVAAAPARGKTQRKRTGAAANPKRKRR